MFKTFFVVCSLIIVANLAQADSYKVVTVDVNKIINDLPESTQKKNEINKIQKAFKDSLENKKKNIQALEQKFKAGSKDPQSKEAVALRDAIRDYEQTASKANAEVQKKFLESNKELTDRVVNVIRKYAKNHDISLVLDKNDKGTSALLYGDESVDITGIIAKEVD